MDMRAFEDIGLTPGETKTYFALLKLGESATGAIAKESQVSRSKLYVILDKLTKKGLVGHIIRGKTMYFKPMDPERILDYVEERKSTFSHQEELIRHMIPDLKKMQREGKPKTEATLFQGLKSIKNFYLTILDEVSSGSTYYVLGAAYGEDKPGVKEFFENYHAQRAKKNIKVKMLANHDVRDHLMKSTYLNSEIRFLPHYLLSNMIVVFYKKKSFVFFLSEEPTGFLIENEEITNGFKAYFDAFWKIAKP